MPVLNRPRSAGRLKTHFGIVPVFVQGSDPHRQPRPYSHALSDVTEIPASGLLGGGRSNPLRGCRRSPEVSRTVPAISGLPALPSSPDGTARWLRRIHSDAPVYGLRPVGGRSGLVERSGSGGLPADLASAPGAAAVDVDLVGDSEHRQRAAALEPGVEYRTAAVALGLEALLGLPEPGPPAAASAQMLGSSSPRASPKRSSSAASTSAASASTSAAISS